MNIINSLVQIWLTQLEYTDSVLVTLFKLTVNIALLSKNIISDK